jgi:hypothetical protein
MLTKHRPIALALQIPQAKRGSDLDPRLLLLSMTVSFVQLTFILEAS